VDDPVVSQLSEITLLPLGLVSDVIDDLKELLLAISEVKVLVECNKLFDRAIKSIFLAHLKHFGCLLRAELVLVLLALELAQRIVENVFVAR